MWHLDIGEVRKLLLLWNLFCINWHTAAQQPFPWSQQSHLHCRHGQGLASRKHVLMRAEVWGVNYFLKEVAHLAISPFKKGLPSREKNISPNCCPLLELMFSSHEKTPVQVSSRVGQNGGGSWIRNPSYNLKNHRALTHLSVAFGWVALMTNWLAIWLGSKYLAILL